MTTRQATRRTAVKIVLGTSRKTTKTKRTTKTTSWNKHEPCKSGHDVTISCCKQEPNEPNATSWYKQELAMILSKMEPEVEEPVTTISIVCNKTSFSIIVHPLVCKYNCPPTSLQLNQRLCFSPPFHRMKANSPRAPLQKVLTLQLLLQK